MDANGSSQMNTDFWRGKNVFVTGHTGFKGSWLTLWLRMMGAKVTGYSLTPNTVPSLFEKLALKYDCDSYFEDINDVSTLRHLLLNSAPDVIFHLAAQPIVSVGYDDPTGTFRTNVMGVVNLLEACRELNGNIPIIIVSSDKCYENDGMGKRFMVGDALGGKDPYSASKACTEIVTQAYQCSFFNAEGSPRIASARAGNVVGGGDWSENRLLPDAAKAFQSRTSLFVRNRYSKRPWQHVLEPIFGYLMLAERLCADANFSGPWNFGPDISNNKNVEYVVEKFTQNWGGQQDIKFNDEQQSWKEATLLDLCCDKTEKLLGWKSVLGIDETIKWTANWYKNTQDENDTKKVREITLHQIHDYHALQKATVDFP